MITTHKGRTFEIFLGGTVAAPLYYAHTHCWCGSTLGSGEWFPTIGQAQDEAEKNIEENHEKPGKHAPTKRCDECGGAGAFADGLQTCEVCRGHGLVPVRP